MPTSPQRFKEKGRVLPGWTTALTCLCAALSPSSAVGEDMESVNPSRPSSRDLKRAEALAAGRQSDGVLEPHPRAFSPTAGLAHQILQGTSHFSCHGAIPPGRVEDTSCHHILAELSRVVMRSVADTDLPCCHLSVVIHYSRPVVCCSMTRSVEQCQSCFHISLDVRAAAGTAGRGIVMQSRP